MKDNLINIENISKIYKPGEEVIKALNGVSLHVGKGDYIAINGSFGIRKIHPDEHNRMP